MEVLHFLPHPRPLLPRRPGSILIPFRVPAIITRYHSIPFCSIPFLAQRGPSILLFCEDGVTNDADIAIADNYVDSVILRWQSVAH